MALKPLNGMSLFSITTTISKFRLVEKLGIEPRTLCLQSKCSSIEL